MAKYRQVHQATMVINHWQAIRRITLFLPACIQAVGRKRRVSGIVCHSGCLLGPAHCHLLQEVLSSAQVAPVTTKLECAKLADGAAALVLVPAAAVDSSGSSRGVCDVLQRHYLLGQFCSGESGQHQAPLSLYCPVDVSGIPNVDGKLSCQPPDSWVRW